MNFRRTIGLAIAFACAGSTVLYAQSIGSIVSQTGRSVSKTVQAAQTALTGSPSTRSRKRRARAAKARKDRARKQALKAAAPPLPERRPRRWRRTRQATQSTPPDRTRQTPKKSNTPARTTTKITAPPSRASNPGTPPPKAQLDTWSEVEINIAHARCRHFLKMIDAVTIPQPAIKKGPCGNAAPIKLVSIGSSPKVSVSPPAILNCQMVHALHTWLENDLQPLAKKHLGAQIVTIETISSYSCRNAYGRKTTRLSEHGRANALDIRGFVTSTGKQTRLLAHWGPAQRDIARAKKKAAERKAQIAAKKKAAADKTARAAATPAAPKPKRNQKAAAAPATNPPTPSRPEPAGGANVPLPMKGTLSEDHPIPAVTATTGDDNELGFAPARLGGPKSRQQAAKKGGAQRGRSQPKRKKKTSVRTTDTPPSIPRVSNSRQARFLRAAFKSGCKIFGTILGPEANNAHRNHFHVDLAPRKRGNYCQ